MEDRASREERLREMDEDTSTPVFCPRCGCTAVLRTAKLDARGRIHWQNPTRICVECGHEFNLDPFAGEENIPF